MQFYHFLSHPLRRLTELFIQVLSHPRIGFVFLSSYSQLVYTNNKTFIFKTTVTTYTTQTTFMLVTHAACCTCCISCTCCFLYYLHCRLYKIILTRYLIYYQSQHSAEQHYQNWICLFIPRHYKREGKDGDADPEVNGVFCERPEVVFRHEQHGGSGN